MVSLNGLVTYLDDLKIRVGKVHSTLTEVSLVDGLLVIGLYGCDSFDFLLDLPHFAFCGYKVDPRYVDDDFCGYDVKITLSLS